MAGPVRNVEDVKTSTHREGTLVLVLTIDRLTETPSLIKSQLYAIHIQIFDNYVNPCCDICGITSFIYY